MAVRPTSPPDSALVGLLADVARGIAEAVGEEVGGSAPRAGSTQYAFDLVADAVAVDRLLAAGCGVLSEESGAHETGRDVVVVVDPIDGSGNAARGSGPFGPSLCAFDSSGPAAACVLDLASGDLYTAARGTGAALNGVQLARPASGPITSAHVVVSGPVPRRPPWRSTTQLHATAHELCQVAAGRFDAYVNTDDDLSAPWDYLGGSLICQEAGLAIADARGRELAVISAEARRQPLAATSRELLAELRRYAVTATARG
ncbi:MAG TPA: inositol monophosphatase family protein [Candidatus Limnocylindria bacterium]|nr:inositol monophosphatase family protein [Candidatus Limnocylindria bacterium]